MLRLRLTIYIFFVALPASANTSPLSCSKEVYLFYLNGIWNRYDDAAMSQRRFVSKFSDYSKDTNENLEIKGSDVLYNTTEGKLADLWEIKTQKANEFNIEHPLQGLRPITVSDLTRQLEQVCKVIGEKTGALIVAHSQGNFFANTHVNDFGAHA